tara:strand:- start:123 stop:335 length:213 start_codon:yes stop_codon:yes gene_type:complete
MKNNRTFLLQTRNDNRITIWEINKEIKNIKKYLFGIRLFQKVAYIERNANQDMILEINQIVYIENYRNQI